MKTTKAQQLTYQIEGEFIGFIPKPGGELKYIQVQVGERIIPIKLAKELRETLGRKLVEGDRLSVLLEQTDCGVGSKLKLKSDRVTILGSEDKSLVSQSASVSTFKGIKQVVNLIPERRLTLNFFPASCQNYYILSG